MLFDLASGVGYCLITNVDTTDVAADSTHFTINASGAGSAAPAVEIYRKTSTTGTIRYRVDIAGNTVKILTVGLIDDVEVD